MFWAPASSTGPVLVADVPIAFLPSRKEEVWDSSVTEAHQEHRHRHEQQTDVGIKRAHGLCWNSNKGPLSVEAVFRKQQDSSIAGWPRRTRATVVWGCRDMWLCGCRIVWTPSALSTDVSMCVSVWDWSPPSGHLDCALWAHVAHLYCRRWFLPMAKNMVLSLWNLDNLIDEYYFFILD